MDGHGTAGVSALSGLWLLVFAVDALRSGGGLDHRVGAIALGMLFLGLVVSEWRAHRRTRDKDLTARG
jgi:hypothetical protein